MKRHTLIYLCLAALLWVLLPQCARRSPRSAHTHLQMRVDELNREAFLNRYKSPTEALQYCHESWALLQDSLPDYVDGRLRVWNIMAFNYFMLSQHDSAAYYTQQVLSETTRSTNSRVEHSIAQLLQARIAQRHCRIADCYEILYNLERSALKYPKQEGYLYDYATMEYYITSLTLNYYYKEGQVQQLPPLLDTIETRRRREMWRCDYAQDMAFNYALAYNYMICCGQTADTAAMLCHALDCVVDNLHILADSNRYTTYFMANTLQLTAALLKRTAPYTTLWQSRAVQQRWQHLQEMLYHHFGFDLYTPPDAAQALYRESTALFYLTDDAYQRLGAAVFSAAYMLSIGDTAEAYEYYHMALTDSTLRPRTAPRFEAALYRGLIESAYSSDSRQNIAWFQQELQLLDYIKQNERADFELRTQLSGTLRRTRYIQLILLLAAAALLTVSILTVSLIHRSRALRREKAELQAAKDRDVERIAHVETCLSVLRHDITPFVSYLHNKNLPESMRIDVVDQLVRTFDNIKSWVNLSIPTGLTFHGGTIPLQPLFQTVQEQASALCRPGVVLRYTPTSLAVAGDKLLLQILLRNLVNNAVQHTTQGTITMSATLYGENPRFVQLTVADTGSGMTEEQLQSLFSTDKQPTTGSDGHSGFGLILCRYIIKKHDDNTAHGCRIWAESSPGQGTRMHCLLKYEATV